MAKLLALLPLLLVAVGCGSVRHAASAGPVPWVNQPRPRYETPPPEIVRYPASAPPCSAAQLRVRQGRTGAATGNLLEELVFTNTGAAPCLLRGYPTVMADTPTGRRVLHPRHGTFFGELVSADLQPGSHVFLDFGTSDCGCRCESAGGVRYRNLVFTLPQGGQVDGGGVTITNGCVLDMSAFGLPERLVEPKARPGTPGTLKARLTVPGTVQGATMIHYIVTLTNPTDVAVSLHPCPGYTDSLGRSFALNCDAVHAIPPHGQVDYAMRLRIPERYTQAGLAKIAWRLNTPTGPSAVAVARVARG